ncbi:hypothetical protein [Streptomyces sp. KLOTTS4A1]|uniref:hypothetical protein n=1 Tax=Streptomyces sp. KLOTTS4A1 TaxID=3390996 RepID=UPI0039F6176F
MDQRIGKKDSPLHTAASMDPGLIPGITPGGRAGEAEDSEAAKASAASGRAAEESAEETEQTGTAASDTEAPASDASDETEDSGKRPAFEARDHRGAITVNAEGIGFTLDDQATDFTWDEVVAVEHSTPRFAKRLTVTVHTKGERWYPNEVQAPDRATLTRWSGELDVALDAYFEE